MGKSLEKYVYERSPIGKIQAYIRRFHNIKELSDAFNLSEDFTKANNLRVEMEKMLMKETDDFSAVELKFLEEKKAHEAKVNDILYTMLSETADILKKFEENYGK